MRRTRSSPDDLRFDYNAAEGDVLPPADGDPHADVEHDEGNEGKKEEEEEGALKDIALQLVVINYNFYLEQEVWRV